MNARCSLNKIFKWWVTGRSCSSPSGTSRISQTPCQIRLFFGDKCKESRRIEAVRIIRCNFQHHVR